jgi:hypothetical protein
MKAEAEQEALQQCSFTPKTGRGPQHRWVFDVWGEGGGGEHSSACGASELQIFSVAGCAVCLHSHMRDALRREFRQLIAKAWCQQVCMLVRTP